jgi:hypothetical protein
MIETNKVRYVLSTMEKFYQDKTYKTVWVIGENNTDVCPTCGKHVKYKEYIYGVCTPCYIDVCDLVRSAIGSFEYGYWDEIISGIGVEKLVELCMLKKLGSTE